MFALPLTDAAQLRPLEPWQAQEFLAHIDRARPLVDPWIPWATFSTDLGSATATLQRYADRLAADGGRIHGIWLDGTLVGGVMFTRFDSAAGTCEIGCWLEPAGQGKGLATRACRALVDWAFAERGMSRVEWWVAPGNVRSVEVARRLGMTREGVLRQRSTYRGVRRDSEVWSVLAEEWPPPADLPGVGYKAGIDRLMRDLFGAFTTTGGRRPDLDVIRRVFLPQGLIIKNIGDDPLVYDIEAFIASREKMLTDGTLTEFSEAEVTERTEMFGSVAQRFSDYRKSGFLYGEWFEGAGHKTVQFVRTPDGWRISSLAWDDEPAADIPAAIPTDEPAPGEPAAEE
ncbi:GNAT family N-acetyltransferase [Streptomyces sp. NBC_00820]|uniref:GNAT family N-acetyltransferase n=1 Tax=Streptomyces sp. NBC_00820 TaxID=2975842 RepID=UPI002ED5551C|nr:GNAT family N-acetyltransferase [Streptomyces sp. NBC_00820]